MQLTREIRPDANLVHGYGPGRVRINQQTITCSLIVNAAQILRDWPPRRIEDLLREHLQTILTLDPEIIILGTGARTRFPDARLTAEIIERGIGLEVMDNAAACRTYNVLVQERRRVALALLLGRNDRPSS